MRTIRLLMFPLLAALLLAMPSVGRCQYPAFTLAGMGTNASYSIVRTYTATQAVASYCQGDDCFIALVDVSGIVKQTRLDAGYAVRDMRIVDNELYFCGENGWDGFMGHLNLTALNAAAPVVNYYSLPGALYPLSRMVAYRNGSMTKVVAIGRMLTSVPPCLCLFSTSPYLCAEYQVVESDWTGGSMTGLQSMSTTVSGEPVEELYDVVETDNYVAVVAVEHPGYELTIHRCDKDFVLSTFDSFKAYPIASGVVAQEGYIGCRVKEDIIAVASAAVISSAPIEYYTQVRTFDLESETMLTAQQFKLLDKTLPADMVYYPTHSTLVLLEPQELTPDEWRNTFVHLKPFGSTPYWAQTYYEKAHRLDFVSIDKAGANHYLATGGRYWMLKDMTSAPMPSGCYGQHSIEVMDIPIDGGMDRYRNTYVSSLISVPITSNDCSTTSYGIICQQP